MVIGLDEPRRHYEDFGGNMMTYEKCCLCGKTTDISFDTPIDKRNGYIEGFGQLCMECYLDSSDPGRKNRRENEKLTENLFQMISSQPSDSRRSVSSKSSKSTG